MKIKEGFVKREVMGKTVIVPTGEAGKTVSGMIKLNRTAAFIWDSVEAGKTVEETAECMKETFEIPMETALSDTEKIVAQMKEAGVFED